jgi:hypothetical protein
VYRSTEAEASDPRGHLLDAKGHVLARQPVTYEAPRFLRPRSPFRMEPDLALFVRSRTVQRLRKLPPSKLRSALEARYGRSPGHIRYAIRSDGVTFTESSTTGRRFVVVVRNGRIVRENVKPLAFVF